MLAVLFLTIGESVIAGRGVVFASTLGMANNGLIRVKIANKLTKKRISDLIMGGSLDFSRVSQAS
mgnify:CR=1 FL=1